MTSVNWESNAGLTLFDFKLNWIGLILIGLNLVDLTMVNWESDAGL